MGGQRVVFLLFMVVGGAGRLAAGQDTVYLTLEQAIRLALKRSPVAVEVDADRWQGVLSAGEGVAAVLPVPGLNLSREKGEFGSGYNINWSLTQPVFDADLFRTLVSGIIRSSYYSLSAREKTARLVYEVTSAYFNLLRSQLFFSLAEKGVKQAERHLVLMQERFRVGQVSKVDLLRASVFYSRAQLNLLNAERGLKTARQNLCALTGISRNKTVVTADEVKEPAVIDEAERRQLLERIIRFNPGLGSAGRLKTQALVGLIAGVLRVLPSVSVYRSGWYSDSVLPGDWRSFERGTVRKSGWSVSLPVVDLKSFILNLVGAVNASRRSRAEFARVKLELYVTAQNAILEYEEAMRRYQQAKENLDLNRELYDFALIQYQLGSIPQSELLDIEEEFNRAEGDYLSALCDTYIQSAQIAYLLGLAGGEFFNRR